MNTYVFQVSVEAGSYKEAVAVMGERLDHDDDYGFPYSVEWDRAAGGSEWDCIWTSHNGGFEVWRNNVTDEMPFTLFHHGEWVGVYWYTQQAKRDAVPLDCSKCEEVAS